MVILRIRSSTTLEGVQRSAMGRKEAALVGFLFGFRSVLTLPIFQTSNIIPNIWKIGKIITLLKPNRNHTEAASYWHFTLLSTPSKVVERLILKITTPHIPMSPTKHGYKPNHSVKTLLSNLTLRINDGINFRSPPKRSLLITIDISKAFDAIPHTLLINKICPLRSSTKHWLANCLSGKQSVS